jgi:hypothetical protein
LSNNVAKKNRWVTQPSPQEKKGRYGPLRAIIFLLGTLVAAFIGVFTAAAIFAGGVSTALYSVGINITNTVASDQDDIQVAFSLSGADLIAGNFVAEDVLNVQIHKGAVDVPNMPPTNRIQVEGAVQDDGGVFTDYTSAAQDTVLNDLPLLPATAVVNDAMYFGCDNPCRIVTWDIDTAGVGTWTLTYEYWDGDSFEALTNVDDRTAAYTILGRHAVSWDMPTDWASQTVTGSSVTSYWGRARVSAFSSETTQPLGSRIHYENGQWWTWVENLAVNNQEQYTVYLGGATDLTTGHDIFPGTEGIITGDAATLEVTGAYSIGVIARLDFSAASTTTCIVCKTGAITVTVSGSATSPVIGTSIVGGSTSAGDLTGLTIPDTGEQTIIIASDGTHAATFVDAGGGMLSYTAQVVTDNGNNWTWASGGGLDYVESIRVDTLAPTIFEFDATTAQFTTGTHTNTVGYDNALQLN